MLTSHHAQVAIGFETGLSLLSCSIDGIYNDETTDYNVKSWSLLHGIYGQVWLNEKLSVLARLSLTKRELIYVVVLSGVDGYGIDEYHQRDIISSLMIRHKLDENYGIAAGMSLLHRDRHWEELAYQFGPDVHYEAKTYVLPSISFFWSFRYADLSIHYSRAWKANTYSIGAWEVWEIEPVVYQPGKNFFDFRISIPFTRSADELRLGKSKR